MATREMRSIPRTRASLACHNCRRRKVKCDAQTTPPGMKCTSCRQMDIPCAVDRNGDRRKSASRKHVETLEQRIQTLEGFLRQNSQIKSPQDEEVDLLSEDGGPVDAPSQSAHSDLENGPSQATPNSRSFETPAADYLLSQLQNVTPPNGFETLLALDDDAIATIMNNGPNNPNIRASQDANPGPSPRMGSSTFSERRSSTQNSGALGRTSQSHVQLSGSSPQPSCTKHDELADFGIAVDINSAQVKSRLLHSFFRYQTLWVSVVDENLFWEYRKNGESSMWYSEFLETVMLACAARLSTSSAVRSLGESYSAQAMAGIVEAVACPSAASMQGFMLLSEYEVSYGHDRKGWMLCGMACRLLADLGLHQCLDADEQVSRTRNWEFHLLGACIAFEGVWCMYLGRPSSIPRSILQRAASSCRSYQGPEASTLSAWLGLCAPMADICDILNSCSSIHAEAKARLLQLGIELQQWCDSLPPGFAYDDNKIADLDPMAYGVHMQYCKVQILMRQAFCGEESASGVNTPRFQQPIPCDDQDRETAERVIYDAALRIVRLLLMYRQIHGAEKIPSVMLDNVNLALVTLINHFVRHQDLIETQPRDIQLLRLAIESMRAIQPHFPIIGRMLNSLQIAVEGTPLSTLLHISADGSTMPTARPAASLDVAVEAPHRRDSFNTSPFSDNKQSSPHSSLGAVDRAGGPVLNKETLFSSQWPTSDPEELSVSLLGWPNPQIESFWSLKPASLSNRPAL
ncbi:hypothetical protein BDV18DRAFT_134835 [Aspergillus unguis]